MADRLEFHREFYFLEPGGQVSVLRAGRLPAPFHFSGSLFGIRYLTFWEKAALARGLLALRRERQRADLDRITMLEWLREKRQPARVIERFWGQVLVSAVNETLDRMAAAYGFQVFYQGFLARRDSYEMGVPGVTLAELYGSEAWSRLENVRLQVRAQVDRIIVEHGRATGVEAGGIHQGGDYVISAVPFERLSSIVPELRAELSAFEHSPITGIHLWFDRPVTELPHATLLDRTIQWFFNKSEGRYLQLVVSASRGLLDMPRNEVIDLALRELAEFLPGVRSAKLEKAHVVKEVRATFSAKPGMAGLRLSARTGIGNLFLAGDWTNSGWPATMEGAVRSGYIAAEAVASEAGTPARFLLPDLA
jgi:zeta-carotene desaturase